MTKIIDKFYSGLTIQLAKISKIDGRFLLAVLLIGYFLPLFLAIFFNNYSAQWNSVWIYPLVSKLSPPFADMRVITSGAECIRLGYDVLIQNPCDPWQRPMNYPRIWSIVASWGLDQSHTVILGTVSVILLFISIFFIIKRLNYAEALIYALILCSPSVMLLVERGNIDTIIFTLFTITLLILKSKNVALRIFGYILIFFASILKLYPIFALVTCIREKKTTFIFTALAISTAFIIYLSADIESLKLISNATPRPISLSYGGMVIFDIALSSLTKYSPNLLNSQVFNIFKYILFFVIILSIFIAVYLAARKSVVLPQADQSNLEFNLEHIDSFRLGAGIYIGTFLLGNNYDYRLTFLVFIVPQLLAWIKNGDRPRLTMIALIGIILTLWLSSGWFKVSFADELINWFIFAYFAYMLILTLPKWMKNYIYFQPKNLEASL